MGINYHELLEYVIHPTLMQLGVESNAAELLLLATACHHSDLGNHLHTETGIGLYGINEALHKEVWDNHIAFDCELASTIRGMASQHDFVKAPHVELVTNLRYSTAIAWMIYQYRMLELPKNPGIKELTDSWQRCFLNHPVSCADREAFENCLRQLQVHVKSIAA